MEWDLWIDYHHEERSGPFATGLLFAADEAPALGFGRVLDGFSGDQS